jgi:hypothetical protein
VTVATTPAVGGERLVPLPDAVARDYLVLCLRLDQHIPGLVDGYFGPADLKAQVDMEQLRSPARVAEDAAALRARLANEVDAPDRRRWLDVQLVALETHARALAGDALPYLDLVERTFDFRPQARPDDAFRAIAARLDALLPGRGPVVERLAALDEALAIPPDKVAPVADWLADRFRARADELFGLPEGESLRISFVRNQPWSGYNWYDGGLQSRVDINLDLPIRAPVLIHTIAHETYAGHHLEHAWKEADVVLTQGRLECSALLINAPECLISEGLADLGMRVAMTPADVALLLAEAAQQAGLDTGGEGVAAWADRQVEINDLRDELGAVSVNAALLRHVEGRSHEDVAAYLREVGLRSPDRAEKSLEFIEHPLWRTYVFVYTEGEQLLRRWVGDEPRARVERFGRLLREQITPGQVVDDLAAGGDR